MQSDTTRDGVRNRSARVTAWLRSRALYIDAALLALVILAIAVAETGGFRYRWLGIVFSITRASRPVLLAIVLFGIRQWFASDVPLFAGRFGALQAEDNAITRCQRLPAAQLAAVAAGAVLLAVVMTWPQALYLQSVPDLGDPLFSTWRLAWVAHQLPRAPLELFDGNIFYPERGTFALSDPTIIPALMAAPLMWLGVPPVAAYNVIFLSTFALTGLFTFLFVRALVGRTDAAVIAAIIFAFYPNRFEQYSHLEQVTFWVPLAAWAFHRTFERGRLRDGLLTGAAIAAQFLSSVQHGLFFVAFLAPVGAVLWWAQRPPIRAFRALAAGAVLAFLLVLPVAVPLVEASQAVGERPVIEVAYYSARASDYLTPHPRSTVWGWTATSYSAERCLFPGVLPVALAIIGLWPPFSAIRLAYAAALAFAFDLSLGFHGLFYPLLYSYVLPYRGLRVPARLGMFVGFALAIAAAYGVKRLAATLTSPRRRVLLTVSLTLLVIIEVHASLALTRVWPHPPEVYRDLDPSAVLAEFPAPADIADAAGDTRYMYFSVFHWRRLLNGYSGFLPASYLEFMMRMHSFPDPDALAYLADRHADFIIVHGAFMETNKYLDTRRVLDRNPSVTLVKRFNWEGREGSVYRLIRSAPR